MEHDKLCDSKIRTQVKNKNMRCAKPTCKQIFIILTYVNMDMKRIWKGYGARLWLKLMLNILKEMKGLTPIYTPLGT